VITRWVFLALAMSSACGGRISGPIVPEANEPFTRWLVTNVGGPTTPPSCEIPSIDLGQTWLAPLRQRQLRLPLPVTWAVSSWSPPYNRVLFPVVGWRAGDMWMEGINLMPAWDRWQYEVQPGDRAATVLQVVPWSGYQPFSVAEPWTVVEPEECLLSHGDRQIRVLRFGLRHPTLPTQWGLVAFWQGRPADGRLSLIALGPDRAVQAEATEILRRHLP